MDALSVQVPVADIDAGMGGNHLRKGGSSPSETREEAKHSGFTRQAGFAGVVPPTMALRGGFPGSRTNRVTTPRYEMVERPLEGTTKEWLKHKWRKPNGISPKTG